MRPGLHVRERHCFGAIRPLAKTLGSRFRRVNATVCEGIAPDPEKKSAISLL
jgi:hypothetical protein